MVEFNKVQELFNGAKNILIVAGKNSNPQDSLPGIVSLSKYLNEMNSSIKIQLLYTGDLSKVSDQIKKLADVSNSLEDKGDVLKIDIDYANLDVPIEKFNYYRNDADTKLTFEIKPIDKSFNEDRVKVYKEINSYDLVISVGVKTKEELDAAVGHKTLVSDSKIVNIDNAKDNDSFGDANFVQANETLCLMIFNMLTSWGYKPTQAVARCLLVGFQK